jgi:predicted nucleic acid-binding protein
MIATIKSSAVVIDAGLGVLQVIADPLSGRAEMLWSHWIQDGVEVCAPRLWLEESTSALHKIYMQRIVGDETAQQALEALLGLDITFFETDRETCLRAFHWATRLNQYAAYDGYYLALAEKLNAVFWSTDQRLVNRARQLSISWVHSISE